MNNEMPSIQEIENILIEAKVVEVGDDASMRIGKVLIASAYVGEDSKQLAIACGLAESEVVLVISGLRAGNVFGRNVNHAEDYLEGEESGLTLQLDIGCATGKMRRDDAKEPSYSLTRVGKDYVEQELLPQILNDESGQSREGR